MQARHARYPFLGGAREAVDAMDVDMAAIVTRPDDPVVERALARVSSAITDGDIGTPHPTPRVELLSYPIARVLVSLVDEQILLRRYSRAEAQAAIDRFADDLRSESGLKSTSTEPLKLSDLLEEFGIQSAVHRTESGYQLHVSTYLRFASSVWGDEWRLVNRTLANGFVDVTREELVTLLREAIADRVADGLPLSVPDAIAEPLTDHVESIHGLLDELELTREIDTVVPERFPPCMTYLLDQIQRGEHLAHHSRFAITAFLASIGMTTDEIVDLYMVNSSFGENMTRYQTNHIRGETSSTAYTPPSCATMQSYGDCINKDDRCETISHPLAYYERALDDADEDDLIDWRERTDRAENGDS